MSTSRLGFSRDVFTNIGAKLYSTKILKQTVELRTPTPIETKLYQCMFFVDSKERAKEIFKEYNISLPDNEIITTGKIEKKE